MYLSLFISHILRDGVFMTLEHLDERLCWRQNVAADSVQRYRRSVPNPCVRSAVRTAVAVFHLSNDAEQREGVDANVSLP